MATEDSVKCRHENMCKIHGEKKLEYYCVKCDLAICLSCKQTSHERHRVKDMEPEISKKKTELESHKQRLQGAMSVIATSMTSLQTEKQDLEKKREQLEKNIHNRHATIVAAADRERDKVLKSLQSLHTDLDNGVDRDIEQQQGHREELSSLLQQLENALSSRSPTDVINVAKEIRNERERQTAITKMASPVDRLIQRPSLRFDVSIDKATQMLENYMGKVFRIEMNERAQDFQVTEYFQCAQDPDVKVFSLCHNDRDPRRVWVSYEQCGMKKDVPIKAFTETGECVVTNDKVGKVSCKRYAEGHVMVPTPQSGWHTTFCKSPTAAHFSLDNNLSGKADIDRTTVTSTDPFKSETKTEFTIKVGPHRAFDVDNTEQYFAVVEEAKESTLPRSVHMYRRSTKTAVSTYTPPTEECQPSDVCFYKLGGKNVLLVTDEGTDSIHVVKISGDRMHFAGYLIADCPSLVQPTAITVDVQDHDCLWVACKGGSVLKIEWIG